MTNQASVDFQILDNMCWAKYIQTTNGAGHSAIQNISNFGKGHREKKESRKQKRGRHSGTSRDHGSRDGSRDNRTEQMGQTEQTTEHREDRTRQYIVGVIYILRVRIFIQPTSYIHSLTAAPAVVAADVRVHRQTASPPPVCPHRSTRTAPLALPSDSVRTFARAVAVRVRSAECRRRAART